MFNLRVLLFVRSEAALEDGARARALAIRSRSRRRRQVGFPRVPGFLKIKSPVRSGVSACLSRAPTCSNSFHSLRLFALHAPFPRARLFKGSQVRKMQNSRGINSKKKFRARGQLQILRVNGKSCQASAYQSTGTDSTCQDSTSPGDAPGQTNFTQ